MEKEKLERINYRNGLCHQKISKKFVFWKEAKSKLDKLLTYKAESTLRFTGRNIINMAA